MTAFAGESWRAIAGEIGNQISAIGAEQARTLSAIIGIDLAALTFPSWQAIALVATLLKSYASRTVIARISAGCTRIYLHKNSKIKLDT